MVVHRQVDGEMPALVKGPRDLRAMPQPMLATKSLKRYTLRLLHALHANSMPMSRKKSGMARAM